MNYKIPKDQFNSFNQEISHRWDDFIKGLPLFFGELSVRKNKKGRTVITCNSKCYFQQNLTNQEAKDRIELAKQELSTLIDTFPKLKDEIDISKVDFEFCYDYGTAAVVVAKETEGVFTSTIQK
jgi:hypothetical protein